MYHELTLIPVFITIVVVSRLVHLYGRSAYEANEYGGPFIPTQVTRVLDPALRWLTRVAARGGAHARCKQR